MCLKRIYSALCFCNQSKFGKIFRTFKTNNASNSIKRLTVSLAHKDLQRHLENCCPIMLTKFPGIINDDLREQNGNVFGLRPANF